MKLVVLDLTIPRQSLV